MTAVGTLRVICIETDAGHAIHIGGPVKIIRKTFDISCSSELAEWLSKEVGYGFRAIEGVEFKPGEIT